MGNNSKKAVVRAVSAILKSEPYGENKLVLVTPYGIITGKPVAADSIIDKAQDDLEYFSGNTALATLSAVYAKASSNAGSALSDDALLLSDVTVYPKVQQPLELGQLIVFYDHIEAVTLGSGFVPE